MRKKRSVVNGSRRDYSWMAGCLMLGSRVVSSCAVACAKESQDGRLLGPPRKRSVGREEALWVESNGGREKEVQELRAGRIWC